MDYDKQTVSPNITCSYKVALLLESKFDEVFTSNLNSYAVLHRVHRDIPNVHHQWFERKGYVFYHCTQSNHLIWADEADTLEKAVLVEECAQSLLLEIGYYDTDELDEDSEASGLEHKPKSTPSMGM